MTDGTPIVDSDEVPEDGSVLFTIEEPDGSLEEVLLVGTADGVLAWKNYCQHETDQRFDRGMGAAIRDGEIVCPKHGSMFDVESGYCDNGKAKGATLAGVDITVADGTVYLTDDAATFSHLGGIDDGDDDGGEDDDDDLPSSTSHIGF